MFFPSERPDSVKSRFDYMQVLTVHSFMLYMPHISSYILDIFFTPRNK